MLAFRFAARGLRGGVRGLGVVLLCLTLGVAAIAAVGSLRTAIAAGLADSGRALLGGDVEVQTGDQTPPTALLDFLRAHGARVSQVTRLHSLLVAPSGRRVLIDLSAVDHAWPLVGQAALQPPLGLAAALARQPDGRFGIAVDPLALARLGLQPGAQVRVGREMLDLTTALVSAPDRVSGPTLFGSPAVIAEAALPAAGIDVPGAIVSHAVRAALPDPRGGPALAAQLAAAFPDTGWRIRQPGEASPGIERAVDQTALFMSLVGLTSLLVGGVGAASGVRAWLDSRMQSLAVLRCLGASARLVFAVAALQVGILAALGIGIGVAIGAAVPVIASGWLAQLLPVPAQIAVYPAPLILAALYGALTAACFALPALSRAMRIPGGALFRDGLIPEQARPPAAVIAVTAGLAVALAGLAVLAAPDRKFALGFCVAAAAGLALFQLGGWALVRGASALPRPRWPAVRLGLATLHRPGAATPLMLTSVGLGLSTLAAVVLIEGNIANAVLDVLPAHAPSLYFVDIQPDQVGPFEAVLRATPGVQNEEQVPSLRARIVAVNGVPAATAAARAAPDSRWALRGDRGLTYAGLPPQGTRVIAGSWWPADYQGPPLVSLDAALARGWGVGVGATIRVNVLGRDIDLRVANLRDVRWQQLGLNFVMVASPGLLSGAPHTNIATVWVADPDQGALLRRVTDALPNVTAVSVTEILAAVAGLLSQIAAALAATSSITLIAGVLVLVGAVAAARKRRIQEAVILRAVGATAGQLRLAWAVEFGVLGSLAGVLSAVVGSAASWAVMHYVLHETWVFLPGRLAATLIVALAVMLAFGYAGTAVALRAKPAARLRND